MLNRDDIAGCHIYYESGFTDMIHEDATKVSLETFRQRSAGKKVILLYPWTNYRSPIFRSFCSK